MDYPFRTYSPFLMFAALIFLFFVNIEVRFPVKMNGQKFTVAYPLSLKLLCVCLLIFIVFFAFALAAVHRESIISRIGIFSMLGVPLAALSIEILGRKVEIDRDIMIRSYFGLFFERAQQGAGGSC
jgi:hypothetical protein